jgi:cyclic peptide transporter
MEKLTFMSLFKSKLILPILALFAIINTLWSSSLLVIINNKISGAPLPFLNEYDREIYLFFVVIFFLLTYYFKAYMIRMTSNLSNDMTLKTIDKLRSANYESYLRLGEARVRTSMEDIAVLTSLPEVVIVLFNAVIMIFVTIGYIFWICPKGAILIVFLIIILYFLFLYRNKLIEKNMDTKRDLDNIFMQNYNDFLHGFNKIKMSTKRSNVIYFDHITKNRDKAIKLTIKYELAGLFNNLTGEFSFYFIIGIILFMMPIIFSIDKTVISGFIIAFLFLMGPLGTLIGHMNDIIHYKIAFGRLNEFNEMTTSNLKHENISVIPNIKEDFENLIIRDVSYQYVDEKGIIIFELKPINLKIQKGEIIFISGGNGSGKSTFVNLLTGLYIPNSGEIFFNQILITDDNRAAYRDMISCIFSDNYLFSDNYDNFNLLSSNESLSELLKKLDLDKVIRHDEENNKIFQTLSTGQKKRLALIYSVLEDKDIFIFDEWAAEQDPDFRKYFYETVIPDLKSKGKTIIAITHDDGYYKFCDRLIRFNYGEILEKEKSINF